MPLSDADLTVLAGATIALDLDGTLVDTAPDLLGTLNVLLADEGLPTLGLADVRAMIGHGARALIAQGFASDGRPVAGDRLDALFERFIAHYRLHIADESRPFPGVVAALDLMRGAGARLAVCTNKPTDLSVALLRELDLTFDAIVGLDAVPAPKPAPGHLLAAIERAGGDARRAVMVGDSNTDAATARAAGIPLVLVSFGYTEVPAADLAPDILIDHFDDLPAACVRLLAPCSGQGGKL